MGAGATSLSASISKEEFEKLCGDLYTERLFYSVRQSDGTVSQETVVALFNECTDVFLTHDWGKDELGRDNHARVSKINTALQS